MKNIRALAISGIILTSALAMTACNAVETKLKTNQVRVNYVPPKNSAHQPMYELLKERQSLEQLQKFLSPFRLQRTLNILLTGCDGEADAMYSDHAITICYEYIEDLQKYMPEKTTPTGVDPIDAVIGPLVDTVLHEFAHALFDYHEIPILGREEDAADQVSAYIYLQTGKDEARRLIAGTVYAYLAEVQNTDPPDMEEYADEHSTPEQRAINLMCIAYGADPELFEDVVVAGGLPQARVEICEEEYDLFAYAYQSLIGPYVDSNLAEKIFDESWLPKKKSQVFNKPN